MSPSEKETAATPKSSPASGGAAADARETVRQVLRGIAPEADLDQVPPDADLRQTLDIDSFDFLNLLIGIEERLGVHIAESDYPKIQTLSSLLAFLERNLKGR